MLQVCVPSNYIVLAELEHNVQNKTRSSKWHLSSTLVNALLLGKSLSDYVLSGKISKAEESPG